MNHQAVSREVGSDALSVEGVMRWGRWAHRRLRPIRPLVLNDGAPGPGDQGSAVAVASELRRLSLSVKAEAIDGDGYDFARASRGAAYRELRDVVSPALRAVDPVRLGDDASRLAFWINVYNAAVVHASVALGLRERVDELGGLDAFFVRAAYDVGGQILSLDDMEHGILRANAGHSRSRGSQFPSGDARARWCVPDVDARIHFALHCGAASCPAVGVLEPDRVERQLDEVTRAFLAGPDGAALDEASGRLIVPAFMRWNADDFGGETALAPFVQRYVDLPAGRALREGDLVYREYDWRLG